MEVPLKIGLVSSYDFAVPGGVNTHIQELAAQFESWGQQVRVIAPCSDRDRVTAPNFIPMGRPVPFPSQGSIARVSVSMWLRSEINSMLDREAFDIVHLHEPFSGYVPLSIIGQSSAVKVATFHSYPGSRLLRYGGTKVARRHFRRLHGVIAVSRPAYENYNRYFPADYRIIPNGIRIDDFAKGAAPLPQYQDGMINLLFLGRLERRKGLKHMLAAYSQLKWEWPNLRLLVVGGGEPDEESHRIMSERNLQDVVFVGRVPDEERASYYRTADIFCAPATGQESFGVVLLEAMAAGKPIVASAIEGYSTVITHGEDGLLVEPRNDPALVEGIDTLLRDPGLREKLAANGRRTAEEFRWERVARRVFDFYGECLDSVVAVRPG